MSTENQPTELELAALLASKICHDIISPVGAINNGLEVMEEESNEDMRTFAMDLIRKSAKQASAKLQFARIAFGAAGSQGAEIDTGDAQKVAEAYFAGEKADLKWQATRVFMAKNKVKLILNLLLTAAQAIPRGGNVIMLIEGEADAPHVTIAAQGANARIPAGIEELVAGELTQPIDAHSIQPFYTGLLARSADMDVSIAIDDDKVTIIAKPKA